MVFPLAVHLNNDSGDIVLSAWQLFAELGLLCFNHQRKWQNETVFVPFFSSHFLLLSVLLCYYFHIYYSRLKSHWDWTMEHSSGIRIARSGAASRVSVRVWRQSEARQCKPPRGKLSIQSHITGRQCLATHTLSPHSTKPEELLP